MEEYISIQKKIFEIASQYQQEPFEKGTPIDFWYRPNSFENSMEPKKKKCGRSSFGK